MLKRKHEIDIKTSNPEWTDKRWNDQETKIQWIERFEVGWARCDWCQIMDGHIKSEIGSRVSIYWTQDRKNFNCYKILRCGVLQSVGAKSRNM